jgi:MFS family permease
MPPSENPTKTTSGAAARVAPPHLWRNRDYMLLWSGQTVSAFGSTMSAVVFPLLVLSLTNSPAAAGLAGALFALPYILFSLPGGALIDRWDRKRVMVFCDAGRALSLASVPVALALNVLTVWQLYANAFIEGTLFVFFNIAEVASLPRVVEKAQLPVAAAQNETGTAAAGLLGPPIGGLLYQGVGRGAPFAFDAITYVGSVISLLLIRTPFQAARAATARRNLRAEIAEGLSWTWRHRPIRFLALLAGGLNFIYAAAQLLLIVLAKDLGAGEAAIGLMFSIASLGGLLGAVIARRLQQAFRLRPLLVALVWFQVLLFPLYALAPHIVVLGAITAMLFCTEPILDVVIISYRLEQVPDALQGRVNGAVRMLVYIFVAAGPAASGVLLQRVGALWTVGILAAALLVLGVWATASRDLRLAAHG